MNRGPLFQNGYKPQFAGHETFPLRYGWLKKAFDAVHETEKESDNRHVFLDDDAIARFGVGKNMVTAIRHWSTVSGVIRDTSSPKRKGFETTELGRFIFGRKGVDPYMEYPATLWLIHWNLAGPCSDPERHEKTTWYWVFNHFADTSFERERLVDGLHRLALEQGWPRSSQATIKRDVECFVRTYAARPALPKGGHEDALESPLTELGLIKPIGKKDGFRLTRGPKLTLGLGVFVYALVEFWSQVTTASTLSLEAIAHEPGSPGRTFLLDENSLAEYLMRLDDFTGGVLRWSETAGMKQIIRESEIGTSQALSYLEKDYHGIDTLEVAS